MAITVREYASSDLAACASIMSENALWQRYGVTYEAAEKRFNSVDPQKETLLVAEVQGKVLGFCLFVAKGAFNRSGYIQLIGVSPACQGQGVGEEMLNAAEKLAFQRCADMFLTVSDFNYSAQAFYKRQGYSQIGEIPAYVLPDVTELIYRKHKPSEAK